jgi:hypothetical protein
MQLSQACCRANPHFYHKLNAAVCGGHGGTQGQQALILSVKTSPFVLREWHLLEIQRASSTCNTFLQNYAQVTVSFKR